MQVTQGVGTCMYGAPCGLLGGRVTFCLVVWLQAIVIVVTVAFVQVMLGLKPFGQNDSTLHYPPPPFPLS